MLKYRNLSHHIALITPNYTSHEKVTMTEIYADIYTDIYMYILPGVSVTFLFNRELNHFTAISKYKVVKM